MNRLARPLALALTGALLAGCFAGGSDAPGPDDGAAGPLRVALAFPPAQGLSPLGDDALLLSRMGVTEALTALDAAGSPVPALATSWTRVDPTTWRFELRPGVRFQDGTALTAAQVVTSLTTAQAASPVPRALRGVGLTATPDGEAAVVLTTTAPDPVLPQRLSSPALAVLADAAYTGGTVDPVGTATGPFTIKTVNGTESATLGAFADHWDGAPESPGLEVRFTAEAGTRAAALRAGEVDVADALPTAQVGLLEADQLLEVPLPRTVSLLLTTTSPVFADPGLRSAAAQAVDPQALGAGVFEGRADAASGIFGPASPWAAQRTPVQRAPATDPAGARITLATYSDRAELPETVVVLAQALTEAGFTVEQVVRGYADLEPDLLAGTYDAVVASRSYLLDTGDPGLYLSSDLTCEGSYNLARLCSPAVDAGVAALGSVEDVAQRRQDALAVQSLVLDSGAVVPLVHERARIGVGTGVRDVAEDPFERALVTRETRRS